MDVADLASMGFISLDVNPAVRVPQADRTVLAAAEAVVPVAVESSSENRALMALEHVGLLPGKIARAHFHLRRLVNGRR